MMKYNEKPKKVDQNPPTTTADCVGLSVWSIFPRRCSTAHATTLSPRALPAQAERERDAHARTCTHVMSEARQRVEARAVAEKAQAAVGGGLGVAGSDFGGFTLAR